MAEKQLIRELQNRVSSLCTEEEEEEVVLKPGALSESGRESKERRTHEIAKPLFLGASGPLLSELKGIMSVGGDTSDVGDEILMS